MVASTASTDLHSTVASITMMEYDDTSGCSGFSSEGRRLASIALNSQYSDVDEVSSSTSSDGGHGQRNATASSDEFNHGKVNDEQQYEPKQQWERSMANLDFDAESIVPKLPAKTLPSNDCHYTVHDDDDDYDYTENYLEISWKNGAPPTVKEKNWQIPDDFDKIFSDTESIEKPRFKSDETVSVDDAAKKLSKCVVCIATVIFLAAIIVLLLTLTVIPKIKRLHTEILPTKPSTESMTPSPSTSTTLFPTSVKVDEGTSEPIATSSPIIATKPSLSPVTSYPTALPTSLEPTLSPTAFPTSRGSTISPTSSPSVFDQLSRNMSILGFIRQITNSTTLDQYPTEMTATSLPEHKALVWLIEDDPLVVNLSEPVKVAQRFALATIWFGLAGPSWKHKDDWLSNEDECNWFGVTGCTDGVITSVSFDGNGLSGTIPVSTLAALSDLETLALPSNQVSGTIPEAFAYLSHLTSLNLRQNSLTGTIPEALSLCSLLETVILRQNKLSGRLPATLTKLSLMETFLADDNDLTGPIPSSFGTWTNIVDFRIHSNRFEGTVPSFSTWSRIEMFSLYRNKFASTLPSNIAMDWPNLNTLFTGENELGGTLPTEYARLTQLRHIAVNSAKHEGSIPSQYSAMSNLITFVFGNNQLTGTIPSSLASWTRLDSLSGNGNAFIGSLPTAIGNWTSMKVFRMADNLLSGTIPSELSRWTNLNEFNIQNNDISGVLPSSLQSLHGLTYVSVGDNPLLRGFVPSMFGSWSNLRQVNLRGTSLEGSIPWCGMSNNVTVEVECGQFVCDCCTCQ